MFEKTLKYLRSLRFTIVLIALLGAILAIGLWVPQQSLLKDIYFDWKAQSPRLVAFLDFFQLTSVYTSWVTVTLWVLFFLNLTLVMWQRIPLILKRIEMPASRIVDPETGGGFVFRAAYAVPEGTDGAGMVSALEKRGFAMVSNESGFYAVKNRLSPIASVLFHLSFFLILLGGLISFYTEFIGFVDLAVGEPFGGTLAQYNPTPTPKLPKVGSLPEVAFTVTSVEPHVVRNTPTGITVKVKENKGAEHVVDINKPLNTAHSSFVFKHLGVAPLFVLKDPSGREVGGNYFKLDVVGGKTDTFRLGDLIFTARYYQDYEFKDGKHRTKSQEFNNPTFFLVAERDGKKVAEGTVPVLGGLNLAGGYRLEMKECPFWVRFYVIKQRGLSLVYLGFAIASVAVIWRLMFYRRELVGAFRERDGRRCLVVAGKSEYYKKLAEDEFARMCGELFGPPLAG